MKRLYYPGTARSSRLVRRTRGALLVESAIISNLLFLTLFTMADFGLGVLHYNSLSESARRLARFVALSGAKAEPQRQSLGSETYIGNGADETVIGAELRRVLTVTDVQNIVVEVEWPDGGNLVGNKVQVTLTYPYRSIVQSLMGSTQCVLSARSITTIRH